MGTTDPQLVGPSPSSLPPASKMKIVAIIAILFVVQGYVEAIHGSAGNCGFDYTRPKMRLVDFIKWQMDSPMECYNACLSDSDCTFWKFRRGAIRRRRTCSLYQDGLFYDFTDKDWLYFSGESGTVC